MKKLNRLTLLACAGFAALTFSSAALGAYTPTFVLQGSNHALQSGGPVTFNISQAETDDATARIALYAPLGYQATLGQPAGTVIGRVSATVLLRGLGGAKAPVEGDVKTDDPTKYRNNPCTGNPGVHGAVWVLSTVLAGNPLNVPLYVDLITSGAEANFASLRIIVCFNSPYVPPPIGAASGAQLISASFSANVFTNPSTRGRYRWVGIFTPYTVNTATVNAAGTVQSQTIQSLPVQLVLAGKKIRKKGKSYAFLAGSLIEGGNGVARAKIQLMRSTKSAKNVAVFKTITADAKGRFKLTVALKKKTFFRAKVVLPARRMAVPDCAPVTLAPCSSVFLAPVGTTAAPFFSRIAISVKP